MKINDNQYNELVEKLAEELVAGAMEKTAGAQEDLDEHLDSKRPTWYGGAGKGSLIGAGIGAGIGATAGAAASKKPLSAAVGAATGALHGLWPGAVVGAIGGGVRQSKYNEKTEQLKRRVDRDRVKEASEALVEAVIYKQAALQDASEAAIVAEASERALNALGYTR